MVRAPRDYVHKLILPMIRSANILKKKPARETDVIVRALSWKRVRGHEEKLDCRDGRFARIGIVRLANRSLK